jgi:hypothetical protein
MHRDTGTTGSEQNAFGIRRFDRSRKPAADAFKGGVSVPGQTWALKWTGNLRGDWASYEEGYAGSSVTDTASGLRFYAPGSATGRDHVEVHDHRTNAGGCAIPGIQAYEWEFKIPSNIVLPTGDYCTICQFHGNNNPGYTGGVGINPITNQVEVRVSGGFQISGNRYEYENRFPIGAWVPGTWQKVRVEAFWNHDPVGYIAGALDDGTQIVDQNHPTASDLSSAEMFYLGWYPDDVPDANGLDMTVRNVKTESLA